MSRFPKLEPDFVVQSGLASALATGVATARASAARTFMPHWIGSFFVVWAAILLFAPVVTAPIQRILDAFTRND